MTAYARIEGGVVIETLDIGVDPNEIFPPEIPWTPIPDEVPVTQGWLYDDETFSEPPPVEPDIPAMTAQAQMLIDARLAYSAARIGPLQDAVDMGIATPEEVEQLAAWKLYRIEVSRVPTQPGFPIDFQWPQMPE